MAIILARVLLHIREMLAAKGPVFASADPAEHTGTSADVLVRATARS